MLKISVIDSRTECRLVLEGKLIAPWVAELRTAWKSVNEVIEGRVLVIDMGNVAIISQEGENALLELMNAGAKFRCSGVLTKHVIQELRRRCKRDSSKAIQEEHSSVRDDQGEK
jgi:argininosuccinate synthase